MLEYSRMFTYLAEATLQHHLALLPERVELVHRRGHEICGVLGSKGLEFSSLREFPPRIFVNWASTPESVLQFTRRYGLLDPTGKYTEEKLEDKKTRAFSFKVASWIQSQKYFQQYWDWNADGGSWDVVLDDLTAELMGSLVVGAPELPHLGIEVTEILRGPKPCLVLTAHTLWQYLCTLLVFQKEGELRRCQNRDCPAPRFVARRKDQVFCCTDCAALIAKRRWWKKHGDEWRRRRAQKGTKRVKQ